MQSVVMSDVVVRCKIKMWWCNAMWNNYVVMLNML